MAIDVIVQRAVEAMFQSPGRFALIAFLAMLPRPACADILPRFTPAAVWNQDVSAAPLAANSQAMVDLLESQGGWGTGSTNFQIDFSMLVNHADAATPIVPVVAYPPGDYYTPDCDDPGLLFPVPPGGAIEGSPGYHCDNAGDDCHLLVVRGSTLFESYRSNVVAAALQSQCAVRWDLTHVYPPEGRGEQCTSADAAGFPVAALLFNADEMYAAIEAQGDIGHAIRFILPNSRMRAGVFVTPATHAGAPSNPSADAIPYGSRLRLKASFDIDRFSASAAVRALLRGLKKYGMLLADGGNVPLTAEADTLTTHKWSDPDIDLDLHALFGIEASDFEVVDAGAPIGITYACVRLPDPPIDSIFTSGFD